jgi:pimeloyl-ACP methyl ester carboxylesterase
MTIAYGEYTHHREHFYIGGGYRAADGKGLMGNQSASEAQRLMAGQMYVEHFAPGETKEAPPVVMIHGGGRTATDWLRTPDGRPGWAADFLANGREVYLVDQPARGRSPWHPNLNGELIEISAEQAEAWFTNIAEHDGWQEAKLHTQWPGAGRIGDPVFDDFYAAQVPFLADQAEAETAFRAAGAALLERIGPAVLLTHSQSGPLGWGLANDRPELVRAVVSIEPSGPPFQDVVIASGRQRTWGISETALTYEPEVTTPSELSLEKRPCKNGDRCVTWQQTGTPRKLSRLRGVPVLIVTGEASYHAQYDHGTVEYLTDAGVNVTWLELVTAGISGNGHFMMVELNSREIYEQIEAWLNQVSC